MAAPAILKIDIIANAQKALGAMHDTSDAAQNMSGKLLGVGQAVATGMAVTKVVEFGKASVDAARESEVATARLETIFRSMGDTTGKAAKAAEEYASSLSKKIGVDDDAIKAAQAQLATFGAVSDETARAAGIFDRATAAAADLAAAGFGSLDANSVQLGKALQDPTKGLVALAKSGVTFTDAQKDQIKAMQESGDLLGAQKIVLAAVEGQVKGTAAATATSADKMTVAFGETQEAVGAALLPILEKLMPILVSVAGFIEQNVSWLLPLAAVVGVLAVAWNIASVAATLFGVSMMVALGPVLLVIAAVAALIAIGVLIVKNWDTIKEAAATAWQFVLRTVQGVWDWISDNWPLLLAILTGPIGLAVKFIVDHWDSIKRAFAAVVDWITDKWQSFVDFFRGTIDSIKGIAADIANAIKAPINGVIRLWNDLHVTLPKVETPIGDFGGQRIDFPDIPLLASGGSVLRTGLAIVHRGETFSGVGRQLGGSTVINVNVTTTGLGADAPELQRAVVNALRGYVARNGTSALPITAA